MSKIKTTHFYLFTLGCAFILAACSSNPEKRPSPLVKDSTEVSGAQVAIEYSSPAVRKRKIWDELVPYGEVWRTGANKATYLTTTEDLLVNGKELYAGRYAIFTIPTDSTWTIIFNEDWDQWGSYNYDSDKDAIRIVLHPTKSSFDERMKFELNNNLLNFEWEELSYSLSLERK